MGDGTHTVNRDVQDDEKRLWTEFIREYERVRYDQVRVARLARERLGIHEQRARQIGRTWENEGLVFDIDGNCNRIKPTGYGMTIENIESGLTRGDSWR